MAEVGEKEEAGKGFDSLLCWETPTEKTYKALYFGECVLSLSLVLKQGEVLMKEEHVIMQFRLLLVMVEV